MTIISWYRTEEFHLVKLAPRSVSHYALSHGTCNTVEHNIQAWVSVNDNVFRIYLWHLSKKTFCFRNTVDYTIVTAINSCFAFQVRIALQNIHHFHGKIKLCITWFSSWHVKRKSLCFDLFKLFVQLFFQCQKLIMIHFGIFFHKFLLWPMPVWCILLVYPVHFSMLKWLLSSVLTDFHYFPHVFPKTAYLP